MWEAVLNSNSPDPTGLFTRRQEEARAVGIHNWRGDFSTINEPCRDRYVDGTGLRAVM